MKPSKRRDMLIEHADNARLSRELVTAARRRAAAAAAGLRCAARPTGARQSRRLAARAGVPQHADRSAGAGRRAAAAALARSSRAGADAAAGVEPAAHPDLGRTNPSPPLDAPCTLGGARRARGGHGRRGYRDRRPDAMRAKLVGLLAGHRAGPRCYVPLRHEVLPSRCGSPTRSRCSAPVLTDPAVLKISAERQVRHDGAGARRRSRRRAGRRHDADLLRAGGRRCTGTAWTNCRSCISAIRRSAYDEVTGTGRKRASVSPRCRSTAPPPTRRRMPMSRCGCGRRCSRACAATARSALYEQVERRLISGAAGDGARRHQGRCRRPARACRSRFRAAHGGDGAGHATASPAASSMSAAPSSWARCCSTK